MSRRRQTRSGTHWPRQLQRRRGPRSACIDQAGPPNLREESIGRISSQSAREGGGIQIREQTYASPKDRAARPTPTVSQTDTRLRDYRLNVVERVSLASLNGLVVWNRQTLAELREWFREPGKAVIDAVGITSALNPEGSRKLQMRSHCPLVLNIEEIIRVHHAAVVAVQEISGDSARYVAQLVASATVLQKSRGISLRTSCSYIRCRR
jgi:hypothetical protein